MAGKRCKLIDNEFGLFDGKISEEKGKDDYTKVCHR